MSWLTTVWSLEATAGVLQWLWGLSGSWAAPPSPVARDQGKQWPEVICTHSLPEAGAGGRHTHSGWAKAWWLAHQLEGLGLLWGMDVGVGTHLFYILKATETRAATWAGARLCASRGQELCACCWSLPAPFLAHGRLSVTDCWLDEHKKSSEKQKMLVFTWNRGWLRPFPHAAPRLVARLSPPPLGTQYPGSHLHLNPMLRLAAWASSSLSVVSFRIQRTSCMYLYQHIHFQWALTSSWRESKNSVGTENILYLCIACYWGNAKCSANMISLASPRGSPEGRSWQKFLFSLDR